MSFYADMAATATELITEFGAPAALVVSGGEPVYNPSTGMMEGGVGVELDCIACVFPMPDHLINGQTVLAGDRKVLLSVKGVDAPEPSQVFRWQGEDYTIIDVSELAPAGVAVLYSLQVRK